MNKDETAALDTDLTSRESLHANAAVPELSPSPVASPKPPDFRLRSPAPINAVYETPSKTSRPYDSGDVSAGNSNSTEASVGTFTSEASRSVELTRSAAGSMNNLVELSSGSVAILRCYRYVTVELLIFFFFLAMTLTYPVMTALFLVHTCRSTLGFNATTCSALEGNSSEELEALVQPRANMYIMAATLVEACVPAVLSLFVGPWSDEHGRKTFLTAPLLGYVFKYLLCMVFSMFPTLPPSYLLIASVPVSLSGGMVSVFSLSYCYITDITSEKRRGFRMGVLEASFYVGLLLGTSSATYLFRYGGYVTVYGTACSLCLIAFVYGVFFLPESVQAAKRPCPLQCCSCLSGLFDWSLVQDMVRTCCRKRENGGRPIIFLMVVVMAAAIVTVEGEGSVQYLFTRKKFGWNIQQYMEFGSTGILLNILGTLIGVTFLSAWLGIGDAPLAMASFSLKFVSSLICAASPAWWYLYLASAVGLMGGVSGPLCRSVLSKTVEPRDVGKVFSLLCSVEAISPLAASPLYTLVYNLTILSFPGAFYLLSAGVFAIDVILLGIVVFIKRLASPSAYTSLLVE